MVNKQVSATGRPKPPNAGKGRPKGSQNKTTALLKDAILKAAEDAGGKGGLIGYLTLQASENPAAFMTLLGKVLPMQVEGTDGGAIVTQIILRAHDASDS